MMRRDIGRQVTLPMTFSLHVTCKRPASITHVAYANLTFEGGQELSW